MKYPCEYRSAVYLTLSTATIYTILAPTILVRLDGEVHTHWTKGLVGSAGWGTASKVALESGDGC